MLKHFLKYGAIPNSSGQTCTYVKLHLMKSEMNLPLKIAKLFQFQTVAFSMVVNGCCLLLQWLKLNDSSLRNA